MTPKECLEIWQCAAPKLLFNIQENEGEINLNHAEKTSKLLSFVLIEGEIGKAPFKIFVEQEFIETVFEILGVSLSLENIDPLDAGIIFEHFFSKSLYRLEDIFKDKIEIFSMTNSNKLPKSDGFGFTINFAARTFNGILEINNRETLIQIATLLLPYQLGEEKSCPNKSDVIIGPVEVPELEVSNIQPGDFVSLGENISKEIDGYISRKSGSCWRAKLDPTLARITSERYRIIDILKPQKNKKLLGIRIGSVDIKPSDVLDMKIGKELKIERYEGNKAHLLLEGNLVASGNLQNIAGNFCMAIEKMEE